MRQETQQASPVREKPSGNPSKSDDGFCKRLSAGRMNSVMGSPSVTRVKYDMISFPRQETQRGVLCCDH
jgi:hypothetical protein